MDRTKHVDWGLTLRWQRTQPSRYKMAESIDDDERLRRMSDLIGYKYFEETLTLLDSMGERNLRGTQRAKAGFLATLQA